LAVARLQVNMRRNNRCSSHFL